ncbi:hypothetical protein F5Y18DRAFT_435833 [Xylariaceae sp. FL1019]|nr:hypothetical protein F5Y18DRAFT_435833 [Xylariaceae sp. FL1019]
MESDETSSVTMVGSPLAPLPPAEPDYYEDLGAKPLHNANQRLEALYQKLRATHPDTVAVSRAADRRDFRRARAAYDYLSDPQRKAAYDCGYPWLQEQWRQYYALVPSARPQPRPKPPPTEKLDPRELFDLRVDRYERNIAAFEETIHHVEWLLHVGRLPDHPQNIGFERLRADMAALKKESKGLHKKFKKLPTQDPALEGALGLRKYRRFR